MAVGSGLAGQVGVAKESVYGTRVAPARFFRVSKAEVKKKKAVTQGGGLAAGALAQPGALRVVTSTAAEGSLELEVPTTKFGIFLEQIFGGAPTSVVQGATAAYLHTFAIGDNFGKSLTLQAGVPRTTGTVAPFEMNGAKVTSAEFSCERDGLLTCSLEFDGRGEDETQTLAVASFTEQGLFSFKDLSVKLGSTVGAAAAVDGIKKVSVKVERGQDTERIYAGSGGLKAEPIMNDWLKVSGSIDADFIDKTVFNDRFATDTPAAAVIAWTSPTLAAPAFPFSLAFEVPQLFFDGDTPTLEGPDIVSGSFGWAAQINAAADPLLTAKYVTTDTTP